MGQDIVNYGRYGEQSILDLSALKHDYPAIIRMQTYNSGGVLLNRYLFVDSDGDLCIATDLPENLTNGQDSIPAWEGEKVGLQTT